MSPYSILLYDMIPTQLSLLCTAGQGISDNQLVGCIMARSAQIGYIILVYVYTKVQGQVSEWVSDLTSTSTHGVFGVGVGLGNSVDQSYCRQISTYDELSLRQRLICAHRSVFHQPTTSIYIQLLLLLRVFGVGCRTLTTSAPRQLLLANPNLFRNPNMVFESTYLCTATTKSLFPMAPGLQTPRSTETDSLIDSSTHYRSVCRYVFPVSHLLWYWQLNKNNQDTEHTNNIKTICAGGRHTMPPPQGRQAAARSGRWRRLWCHPYKLCSDLNSQPKRLADFDLWPIDLESSVRITCDVGYICANFSLLRTLCSWLRPNVRDRQTDRRQIASSLDAPERSKEGWRSAGARFCKVRGPSFINSVNDLFL